MAYDSERAALAQSFKTRMEKERTERTKNLTQQQKDFFGRNFYASSYYISLTEGLRSGRFQKPSEFIEQELNWAFGTFLSADPRHKDALLWSVDHCIDFPYAQGWNRRPVRTKSYLPYCNVIIHYIHGFTARINYCGNICDILSGNIPKDMAAFLDEYVYLTYSDMTYSSYLPVEIAYELNHGNAKLRELIYDILCGEGNSQINPRIFRGIVMSDDKELHELLGKLLLAARLQEGLRQSICETCDEGTIDAFITILDVIETNDLIRFSSVKRAVGTWLGFITDDSGDLTRIGDKSIKLIVECLKDPAAREKHLQNEDSMALHIALWSYAVHEAQDAAARISQLAAGGTHHQVLTCGYTMRLFNNPELEYLLARAVIARHSDRQDILAAYMRGLTEKLAKVYRFQYSNAIVPMRAVQVRRPVKADFFADDAEFEHFYELFCTLYRTMKKKSVEFSPCIFPWHSEKLTKSSFAEVICCLARLSEDDSRIDFACTLIPETDVSVRSNIAQMLLTSPATQTQKDTLTAMLGDRESFTREWAYKRLKDMSVDTLNFSLIEDMLRFKTSDIRSRLVELLLRRSDDALYDSIRRLLADKLEEKRCAALDLVLQISRDEGRRALCGRCVPLIKDITAKGSKEKVLLESVQGEILDKQEAAVDMLCSADDEYIPVLPEDTDAYIEECICAFEECFPDSSIRRMLSGDFSMLSDTSDALCPSCAAADADIKSLLALIELHKEDSYLAAHSNESRLLGYNHLFVRREADGTPSIPLRELWDEWYKNNINDPIRLLRMELKLLVVGGSHGYGYEPETDAPAIVDALLGKGFAPKGTYPQAGTLTSILSYLQYAYPLCKETGEKISFLVSWWMLKAVPDDLLTARRAEQVGRIYYVSDSSSEYTNHLRLLISNPHIGRILSYLMYQNCDRFDIIFPALMQFKIRLIDLIRKEMKYSADRPVNICTEHSAMRYTPFGTSAWRMPDLTACLRAWHKGMISERELYRFIFTSETVSNVTVLTSLSAFHHQTAVSSRNSRQYWRTYTIKNSLEQLFGKTDNFTEEELSFIAEISRISDRAVDAIVTDELRRGDTPAPCSAAVSKIYKIYGADRLVSILSALGNDALRDNVSSYSNTVTRRANLLNLLGSCVPDENETVETLKKHLSGSGISRQRLIEAALYSPEWIDLIGEYLELPAFKSAAYYFMAHMNESFDDRRKAIIAQFTPLTADELNAGAFDLNWFRSAYNALGAEDFDRVYDAAKYITSGTLHTRARKYADAALGRIDAAQTEAQISDKRNKDLLMAYPVIPLSDDADLSRRYLFLQNFLKESRQFGAQRIASEKAAVEIALTNLAINAGFADVSRLTLRMESRLIEEKRALFVEQKIDDIGVCLTCGDEGEVSISVRKNGKALKSVPAKYKKHELILALNEAKKMLTDQRSRTVRMMEEAMENSTAFTAEEIALLMKNPVLQPLISRLVFLSGEQAGFVELNEEALRLVTSAGEIVSLEKSDPLVVAHPWHLYSQGVWTAFQRILFERSIVQPFKQVFRELYIKTADELGRTDSLRYAGNQIQPARTLGCLKSRRWVADVESGIQKIYYKENIIAHIFAAADWFSPADIEAPTLEWVQFSDRRTGKALKIDDIPEIIFSEVMRDVDMAVSVAHAGGVDPECSHSTIEMREALLRCTLPLFRLANVRIENQRALIAGKLAEYTVHLGSGVIHQRGGAMISILPVHSQHRGKLFLPFADDDPKTAEIISKVLLLAEDQKIKDPSILDQIVSR